MTEQKKDTLGMVQAARHKYKTALAKKKQLEVAVDEAETVYDAEIDKLHEQIPDIVNAVIENRQALEETDLSLEKLEKDLRDAVNDHYDATGEKSPFGDKSGYVSRPLKFIIEDDEKMLEWASENNPDIVKRTEALNKREFNKWVKDIFTEDEAGYIDMAEDYKGLPVRAERVNQINVSTDVILKEIESEETL